jgi:hypothetical protein
MMVWGMANGGIGVAAAPSENRRAIDDDIVPAHQVGMAREVDLHYKQHLVGRCSRPLASLALLG